MPALNLHAQRGKTNSRITLIVYFLLVFNLMNFTLNAQELVCGSWLRDSTTYDPELNYPYSDRFGNKYLKSEVTLPRNMQAPCDCSEFSDIEVPNNSQSFFDVTFMDCVESTGIGFADPINDNGKKFRRVMCKVLAELSQLITQADAPCTGDTPSNVNITVLKSNHPILNDIGDAAFAVGTAVYDCSPEGGVLTGQVWDVINGGIDVFSSEDEEVMHGWIVLNIDPVIPPGNPQFVGYYTGDNINNIGNNHDLYTILLHETVHALGFDARMKTNGFPADNTFPSDPGLNKSYPLFATRLHVENASGPLLPVVERDATDPFKWIQAIPYGDFYGSCVIGGSDPDMYFVNQDGSTVTIFTYNQHLNGTSFSHLDDECGGPFLMGPFLLPGERKPMTSEEINILCSIGYTINSNEDCDCKVVGVHDYGPACLEPESCIRVVSL